MASGGDGGRQQPRNLQGLLKFCMEQTKSEDATGDSHAEPMSEEGAKEAGVKAASATDAGVKDPEAMRAIITSPDSDLARQKQDHALNTIGLYRYLIPGDGNCLFRAVATQLKFGQDSYHPLLRQAAVGWMQEHADDLIGCGLLDSKDEIKETERLGSWPGQAAVVALANIFGINIVVIQGGDKGFLYVQHISPFESPAEDEEQTSIVLAYLYHGHYDAIMESPNLPNPDYDKWLKLAESGANLPSQDAYVPYVKHRLYDTLKGPKYIEMPPSYPGTFIAAADSAPLARENQNQPRNFDTSPKKATDHSSEEVKVPAPATIQPKDLPTKANKDAAQKETNGANPIKAVPGSPRIQPKGALAQYREKQAVRRTSQERDILDEAEDKLRIKPMLGELKMLSGVGASGEDSAKAEAPSVVETASAPVCDTGSGSPKTESQGVNVGVNNQAATSETPDGDAQPIWRVIPIKFSGSLRKGRLPPALSLHRISLHRTYPPTLLQALGKEPYNLPEGNGFGSTQSLTTEGCVNGEKAQQNGGSNISKSKETKENDKNTSHHSPTSQPKSDSNSPQKKIVNSQTGSNGTSSNASQQAKIQHSAVQKAEIVNSSMPVKSQAGGSGSNPAPIATVQSEPVRAERIQSQPVHARPQSLPVKSNHKPTSTTFSSSESSTKLQQAEECRVPSIPIRVQHAHPHGQSSNAHIVNSNTYSATANHAYTGGNSYSSGHGTHEGRSNNYTVNSTAHGANTHTHDAYTYHSPSKTNQSPGTPRSRPEPVSVFAERFQQEPQLLHSPQPSHATSAHKSPRVRRRSNVDLMSDTLSEKVSDMADQMWSMAGSRPPSSTQHHHQRYHSDPSSQPQPSPSSYDRSPHHQRYPSNPVASPHCEPPSYHSVSRQHSQPASSYTHGEYHRYTPATSTPQFTVTTNATGPPPLTPRRRRRSSECSQLSTPDNSEDRFVPSKKWLDHQAWKQAMRSGSSTPTDPRRNSVPIRIVTDDSPTSPTTPVRQDYRRAHTISPSRDTHDGRHRRSRLAMSPSSQLSWKDDQEGRRVPIRISSTPEHRRRQMPRTVPIRVEPEPVFSDADSGLGFGRRGQASGAKRPFQGKSEKPSNWFDDIERDVKQFLSPDGPGKHHLDSWFRRDW